MSSSIDKMYAETVALLDNDRNINGLCFQLCGVLEK